MIHNDDSLGRTASGRYTHRPAVQPEPGDYPPDSRYWQRRFETARLDYERRFGRRTYRRWAERTWPGDTLSSLTWRSIAETVEAALMR
jgi:hypothetical protein